MTEQERIEGALLFARAAVLSKQPKQPKPDHLTILAAVLADTPEVDVWPMFQSLTPVERVSAITQIFNYLRGYAEWAK